jgi:hypothetical protein
MKFPIGVYQRKRYLARFPKRQNMLHPILTGYLIVPRHRFITRPTSYDTHLNLIHNTSRIHDLVPLTQRLKRLLRLVGSKSCTSRTAT